MYNSEKTVSMVPVDVEFVLFCFKEVVSLREKGTAETTVTTVLIMTESKTRFFVQCVRKKSGQKTAIALSTESNAIIHLLTEFGIPYRH